MNALRPGAPLPSVEAWERDHPHEATPRCPQCGYLLGIRRGLFTRSGRDVWLCDVCRREFDA